MKKQFLWLMAVMALLTFSCNKKPKHLAFVPSNSVGVVSLDMESMVMKSVTIGDLFKMVSSSDTNMAKYKDSGIDFMNPVYAFGGGSSNKDIQLGVLFIVKDGAKFEKTVLEAMKKTGQKFETKGEIKYFSDEKVTLGYKGDIGLVLGGAEGVSNRFLEILNTAEGKGLMASNKNFASSVSSKGDIKLWMDYGKFTEVLKKMNPMTSSLGLDDFKDTYVTGFINFEEGKIVGESKMVGNKELFDKYQKMYKGPISADLVKNHPGNDILLSYSMGIDLKELGKEYTVFKGPVDMTLSGISKDLNYDYLAAMFSGEILATLNGIELVKKEKYDYMTDSTYMKDEPSPNFALSLGISDDKKLNPVLDSLVAKGILMKNGNNYALMGGMANVFVKPGALQIVGLKEYGDMIANGKAEKMSAENVDLYTKNAFAMTLDFKVKPEVLEAIDKQALEYYNMVTVENLVIRGERPQGQASKADFVINFKDKKQNSLKSLQLMVMAISKKVEEERKKREEEYQKMMEMYSADSVAVDTTAVAPAVESE